jgi:hypothetical protein
MRTLRVADLQGRLTEALDFTTLTVEEFHLKAEIRDAVMETCCGVHKFHLQYRLWPYAL